MSWINSAFASKEQRRRQEPEEFCHFGRDILQSEELSEMVYQTCINLMAHEFRPDPEYETKETLRIADAGGLYLNHPIYVPCVERLAFTRHIDTLNDGLPDICKVVDTGEGGNGAVWMAQKIGGFPKGVVPLGRGTKYKAVVFSPVQGSLDMNSFYFTVDDHGEIRHAFDRRFDQKQSAVLNAAITGWFAMALNGYADRKHLWIVATEEDYGNIPIRLHMGVGVEHVKSLFYARDLPLTDTGRRRPILHWVKAHQRRIKSGDEVDVAKYLRGVAGFEMDGMRYEIRQPVKSEGK